MNARKPFLAAEWRYLAMLNWEAPPSLLRPRLPAGLELDFHHGKTYVSLVGFRFLSTRLAGLAIPFHPSFEEVNLRFYVRRVEDGAVRRGVVFIKEIVPRWAIARLARSAYNENYVSLPMSHRVGAAEAEYSWRTGARWNRMSVRSAGEPAALDEGSHEQFITEHFWGYAAQRDGWTLEYEVEHPPWRVWRNCEASVDIDAGKLYGEELAELLRPPPATAFLAEGSPVTVFRPKRISPPREVGGVDFHAKAHRE